MRMRSPTQATATTASAACPMNRKNVGSDGMSSTPSVVPSRKIAASLYVPR